MAAISDHPNSIDIQLSVLGKGPEKHDESFNDRAKAFFRKRCGVELTDEDVREIVHNVTAYFHQLYRLREKYGPVLTDEPGPYSSENDGPLGEAKSDDAAKE